MPYFRFSMPLFRFRFARNTIMRTLPAAPRWSPYTLMPAAAMPDTTLRRKKNATRLMRRDMMLILPSA